MRDILRALVKLQWTRFTWALYHWFSRPESVTVALLVFVAVVALLARPRLRRRLVAAGLLLLGTYWLVISPLFALPANFLLARAVPPDRGAPADAVVVLARAAALTGDRYETALDMVEQGRSQRLLIMGRAQGLEVLQGLEQRQLPVDRLISAMCVRTTQHEAQATVVALGGQGVRRIILITDAPHMLRAWLTFRGLGFEVIPHSAPLPPEVPAMERSLLAIREYLGLISYAALGRFTPPPHVDLPQAAQAIAAYFPADRCFLTADQMQQVLSSY